MRPTPVLALALVLACAGPAHAIVAQGGGNVAPPPPPPGSRALDTMPAPEENAAGAILDHLTYAGVEYVTWAGWERLDAFEEALGAAAGRERIKVVPRADMLRAAQDPQG